MAARLMIHFVAGPAKSLHGLSPGTNRQPAHAGTSTTSSLTGRGTASPCLSRLAR
jgi:hypothetical protein